MSILPKIDPARKSGIWGVSGSGKSTLVKKLAARWATGRAVIVIDPTGAGARSLPVGWSAGAGITDLAPGSVAECRGALMSGFLLSTPLRPVTVICDEAPYYLARPLDALNKVFWQGRHRGLGIVLVGQRPSAVAPDYRSQVTTTIYMRLNDRADLNIVAASNREVAAALPHLETGDYRVWP